MNAASERALSAINRRFYDRFAAEFDATRERPWPGWKRLAGHLSPLPAGATEGGGPPAVLDVGCGNGRFGVFLARRWAGTFRYLGLDGCAALLRAAEGRLAAAVDGPELRRFDVLEEDPATVLGTGRFDLVAVFGVLHHVPGSARRRRLLQDLGRLLAPDGILATSIWRLDRSRRFQRLLVPWDTYNRQRLRRGLEPIDLSMLEAGDVLLSWGGDEEHPRYCHFPEDAEIESWIATAEPRLIDRFEADGPSGRDNLYLVWRCAATSR